MRLYLSLQQISFLLAGEKCILHLYLKWYSPLYVSWIHPPQQVRCYSVIVVGFFSFLPGSFMFCKRIMSAKGLFSFTKIWFMH